MDRSFSTLDKERTELVKQHCKFSALNLGASLDEDGQTARCTNALAVASATVLLTVLDFGEYPLRKYRRFSLFRLPDDSVSVKRTVEVLLI